MISYSQILSSSKENEIFTLTKPILGKPILICTNISKIYKLPGITEIVKALYDITLDYSCEFSHICLDEFIIIRGPLWGGKTILLNILGTLDSDFECKLSLMNQKITKECINIFLVN